MKKLFILLVVLILHFFGTAQTLVPYLKKNGKNIFVDSATMKPAILKEYDHASFFYEGLAAVRLNGKSGYINKKGKEVIPLKYYHTSDFTNGLGRVSDFVSVGFINKKGGKVIPLKYNMAENFYEGFVSVVRKEDDKWGFINTSGKAITPFKYEGVGNFSEGLSWVKADKKYGFIDTTGKEITPLKYDRAESFTEGMAIVKIKYLKGFINKSGKEIIPPQFEEAFEFNEGLACVKKKKYGYIDASGKEIIPLIYDYAQNFNKGLAAVAIDNKFQIINSKSEVVVDLSAYQWGYISPSGIIYALLKNEEKTDGGKYVILDKSGKRINSIAFDKVKEYKDEFLKVSINGLWGMYNDKGNEVIACKYEYLTAFGQNGFAGAIKLAGEPMFTIDKAGREYKEQ
jgi:hypothetical protein